MSYSAHVAIDHISEVLNRIRDPKITLAVWKRRLDLKFINYLDHIPFDILPKANFFVPVTSLTSYINKRVSCAHLACDISLCAKWFSRVTNAQNLKIILDHTRMNGAPSFHEDYLKYRMLVIYRGSNFQWMPEEAVERNVGQLPHLAPWIIRDLSAVQSISRGHVVLLKGTVNDHKGLIHRTSPDMDNTIRLRLRIDIVD